MSARGHRVLFNIHKIVTVFGDTASRSRMYKCGHDYCWPGEMSHTPACWQDVRKILVHHHPPLPAGNTKTTNIPLRVLWSFQLLSAHQRLPHIYLYRSICFIVFLEYSYAPHCVWQDYAAANPKGPSMPQVTSQTLRPSQHRPWHDIETRPTQDRDRRLSSLSAYLPTSQPQYHKGQPKFSGTIRFHSPIRSMVENNIYPLMNNI